MLSDRVHLIITLLIGAAFLASCAPDSDAPARSRDGSEQARDPHIIVMIADDLGVEDAPCYDPRGMMTHLNEHCRQALVFERAYTHPYCTPSRASFMTGRHAFRYGATDVLESAEKLPLEAITLPEFVRQNAPMQRRFTYFGKWHLGDDTNGGQENPNLQGFDHFEGNPRQHHTYEYFDYDWFVNGEPMGRQSTYKTTFIVDRFLSDFRQHQASSPHLSIVSFVSPHIPFHLPPNELHTFDLLEPRVFNAVQGREPEEGEFALFQPSPQVRPYYDAMLQALDHEIDRLVQGVTEVSDRPVIFVFLGDNGAAREVFPAEAPIPYRAKSTVYEGGVRIPLMIWSDDEQLLSRAGERFAGMVHMTDLFPTLATLMGVPDSALRSLSPALDGQAIDLDAPDNPAGQRELAYFERGNLRSQPFALAAIDTHGRKLILRESARPVIFGSGLTEFYHTTHDPFELVNLYPAICDDEDADALVRLLDYILSHRGEAEAEQILSRPGLHEEVLAGINAQSCRAGAP